MDLPIDQLFSLFKGDSGHSLVQTILLMMILLNIRSLKQAMIRLEDNHDKRIGSIEIKQEKQEGRLLALEKGS